MRESTKPLTRLWALVFLSAVVSGCAAQAAEETAERFALSCGASDQHGGYMNPIDARSVVSLTIDSSFTDGEKKRIEQAIRTWNEYETMKLTGGVLFKAVEANLQSSSIPKSGSDCGFPGSGSGIAIAKVTSETKWQELGLSRYNPGVTIRCSQGANYVARQVILLKPDNAHINQLESIVLHELGHGIGLDHSCAAKDDKPGLLGCSEVPDGHPYEQAVMFPWLMDPKESLNENDEERAACILNASRGGV